MERWRLLNEAQERCESFPTHVIGLALTSHFRFEVGRLAAESRPTNVNWPTVLGFGYLGGPPKVAIRAA